MILGREALALGTRAGMELCWLYAWAEYTVHAFLGRPFPLLPGAGALAAGAVLTRVIRGRGWRVGWVVLVHGLSLPLAVLFLVHRVYEPSLPWWDGGWIGAVFQGQRTPEAVLSLILVLFWSIFLWTGGVALGRRPAHYLTVCTRFDIGVAAFLGLFLVRWLVYAQGGSETGGGLLEGLLLPYFIFGLFSIGLARNRGQGRKEFLSGPRGLTIVVGGLVSTLLVGVALGVLFLPHLTTAAEAGYGLLRTVATPLGPVLLGILRFLLVGRRGAPGTPAGSGGPPGTSAGETPPVHPGGWEDLVRQVFGWGLLGLLAAVALAAGAVAVWALCRWLLSRTAQDRSQRGLWEQLRRDLSRAWTSLAAWAAPWLGASRNRGAVTFYAGLRRWGTRGGVAPLATETPLEYGARLQRRFPSVGAEIAELVELLHREVYAERPWDRACLATGRRARSRLRNPRLWPSRFRSWLLRSDPTVHGGS